MAASRRPTSYDVARAAGVSQSAVSRAFRAGASVAPGTRARIEAAAKRLGYAPNAMAGALITRRSNLIAVIISNLTNLYYPEVLAELTQRLSQRGMRVLLFALAQESDVDEALGQVWRHRVDGAIAAARLSPAQVDAFARQGVPLVLYNRVDERGAAPSVCCDSALGERTLVGGLIAAGHRRIGLIGGPEDSYVGEERLRAAHAIITAAGLPEPPVARGSFSYASGAEAMRQLFADGHRLDAVVAVNDSMGLGALDVARHELGLDVPDSVSIVGFDGVGPATWSAYQLTSMRQPVRRMVEATVAMLVERIERPGLPPERRMFPGELLPGRSARLEMR